MTATPSDPAEPVEAHLRGRLLIASAALMWSSGGLFAKAKLFDDWPPGQRGILLAFWRALFAGLFLLPFIRQPRWNPRLVPMAACFTLMNATYLTAMTLTTAANAIWLQSTAPLWIFLAGMFVAPAAASRSLTLRVGQLDSESQATATSSRTEFIPLQATAQERNKFHSTNLPPLVCGLIGVTLILACELRGQINLGVLYGLASGLLYAGVVMSLRGLRTENSTWLVSLNLLVAAVIMLGYVVYAGYWPTPTQLVVLAAFGILQMGVPYVLFARGLRMVTSQEASLIGLLEPVLVPIWVYLAWSEQPRWWTIAGGALILLGLLARYGRRTERD